MVRWWTVGLLAAALAGCGGKPPCGLDDKDEELPVCVYKSDDLPDGLEFCPGDQWGTPACESCGCTADGQIMCTEPDPACPSAR